LASAKALVDADQARPWPGLPAGVTGSGTSHRWDSGTAGRVVFLGGTSTGTIETSGSYTGAYAKTFTLTITNAGNSATALFNWTATTPGGGAGTNVLTGTNVPLNEGVFVTFRDGTNTSFQTNDQWHIYVRPDLRSPTNDDLVAQIHRGLFSCSTCHDQHSQVLQPFDPAAPPYDPAGANRHYMRVDNSLCQMCTDCHAARNVTNAAAGSHAVGLGADQITCTYCHDLHAPPNNLSVPLGPNHDVECLSCHQVHYSPATNGTLLLTTNANLLCGKCHVTADITTPAVHVNRTNANNQWPGGQYGSTFPAKTDPTDRGTCLSCHQAHGWPNAGNPAQDYAALLVEQEENLCFTCHDGSPLAKNLKTNYTKTYRHPTTDYSGRHSPKEDGNSASYGTTNRHAECMDCHNAHRLTSQTTAPVAPTASSRLKGVSRVSVANGAAGTTPTYTFRPASDTTPLKEYELCFVCHSSWTTQPAGQTNYAVKFNPNNPSYHPVEAQGKNLNINTNAFVNGSGPTNTMFCTDCHTSDDPGIRGPHASTNRYILKKPYTASSASRTMSSGELCFDCHRYDTYANPAASATIRNYSRFSGGNGHAFHVGSRTRPCYACHDTHASTAQASLIVTGRNPGITTYTRTTSGGTCTPTCHGSQSYTVTYAR
jgi:predicted CXXCH cytochrome family protein